MPRRVTGWEKARNRAHRFAVVIVRQNRRITPKNEVIMDYVIIESSAWEALKSRIEGLRERMSELFGSKAEPTELLPGEAVCRILGVSRRTLQYYRDTAALPFVRIEHKCYYRREDVAALLAEGDGPEEVPNRLSEDM